MPNVLVFESESSFAEVLETNLRSRGCDVTVVDVFEGVGMHSAGRMSDDDLHELECVACPSAGSGDPPTAAARWRRLARVQW